MMRPFSFLSALLLALSGDGKPLDAFLSIAGPSVIGLDLSAARFYALDGVTPTNAAIALAMGQRIYGNAANAGNGHFPNATTLGSEYPDYQAAAGWQMAVGGVPILRAAAGGVAVSQLRITSPSVPATASTACAPGQIAYDASYLYVCVATNQ